MYKKEKSIPSIVQVIEKETCETCFYWRENNKCSHILRDRIQTYTGKACILWEENLKGLKEQEKEEYSA